MDKKRTPLGHLDNVPCAPVGSFVENTQQRSAVRIIYPYWNCLRFCCRAVKIVHCTTGCGNEAIRIKDHTEEYSIFVEIVVIHDAAASLDKEEGILILLKELDRPRNITFYCKQNVVSFFNLPEHAKISFLDCVADG